MILFVENTLQFDDSTIYIHWYQPTYMLRPTKSYTLLNIYKIVMNQILEERLWFWEDWHLWPGSNLLSLQVLDYMDGLLILKNRKKNGLHTYRNLNEYWSQQSNAYIMKEHEFLKIHYKFCWFGWSFFFFIGVLVLINISKKYYIKK